MGAYVGERLPDARDECDVALHLADKPLDGGLDDACDADGVLQHHDQLIPRGGLLCLAKRFPHALRIQVVEDDVVEVHLCGVNAPVGQVVGADGRHEVPSIGPLGRRIRQDVSRLPHGEALAAEQGVVGGALHNEGARFGRSDMHELPGHNRTPAFGNSSMSHGARSRTSVAKRGEG